MTTSTTSRRVRILSALLLLGLAATQVRRIGDLSPLAARSRQLAQAARRVEQLCGDAASSAAAVGSLNAATARSLPPEPSLAATLYHAWLIDVLAETGHAEAQVTPGRIVSDHAEIALIPFTIETATTTEQVSRLLERLAAAPLLHKVTFVRVGMAERGEASALKATIALEAVSLRSAEPRTTLFAEEAGTSPDSSAAPAFAGNPFEAPGRAARSPRQIETTETVTVSAPDTRGDVLLIATFSRGGRAEAWLFDQQQKQNRVCGEQDAVPELGGSARILEIGTEGIVIEREGEPFRLRLGRTLLELEAE